MVKRRFLLVGGLLFTIAAFAQQPAKQQEADTSFTDYEVLFSDLSGLLDSLTSPHNFVVFNISAGTSYFNYASKSSYLLEQSRKMIYAPSISYYLKSGLGISGTSAMVNDGVHMNPYQFYATASYDYLKKKNWIAGMALTHFFT